jgi:hypothetical protein
MNNSIVISMLAIIISLSTIARVSHNERNRVQYGTPDTETCVWVDTKDGWLTRKCQKEGTQ